MLAVPGEWPHPLRTHFRLWPLSGVGGPTPNPVWQRDERLENWIVAAKLRLWAGGVGWRLWICLDCKLHGQLPEDSSPWFPSLHSRLWGVGGGSYTGLLVTQDKVALLAKDLENMGPSFSRLLLACSGEGFGRTFG